jgi:hypothetical protein
MASDYVSLSSVPCEEECAQVGSENYHERMREESRRYIAGLKRLFPMPDGTTARFVNKGFPHDFGTYHEVCIVFSDSDEIGMAYAYHVDSHPVGTWEELKTGEPIPFVPEASQEA